MKKIICTILFIATLSVVGYLVTNKYVSNNQYCDVGIRDISVVASSKMEPTYFELFNMFEQEKKFGWKTKLKEDIRENEDDYVVVTIQYVIKNSSENVIMEKLSFMPQFCTELDVKAYNVKNDTYLLNLSPGYTTGLTQYIIVKKDALSENEIYQNIIESEVKVMWNENDEIGGNFKGNIFKATKKAGINEALNNYSNNKEWFR